MSDPFNLLSKISIVLVRPRIPENIGSSARIAHNMGFRNLIVIRDVLPPREPMAKTATHKAAHLIDNIKHFQNLDQALTDYNIVVGTSARKGKQRFVQYTPRKMVEKLQPYLTENKVAILFGPEDAGLTNEELNYCKMSSYIPTADFSSLNLAQAVAIHCYELYHGIVCAPTEIEPAQEFATHHELESMYGYMEESLHAINFIDETSHAHWMANVRHFFSRHGLTAKDANIVRGICKKFLFHQKSSANRSD